MSSAGAAGSSPEASARWLRAAKIHTAAQQPPALKRPIHFATGGNISLQRKWVTRVKQMDHQKPTAAATALQLSREGSSPGIHLPSRIRAHRSSKSYGFKPTHLPHQPRKSKALLSARHSPRSPTSFSLRNHPAHRSWGSNFTYLQEH